MVSRRLKLKPNRASEAELERILFQLTGLYNWAVRKLWQDGNGGIFYSRYDFQDLVVGHGRKCGLNQQTMDLVLTRAWRAHRSRPNRARPPRLKSRRNRFGAIPIRQDVKWRDRSHLYLPGIGVVKVRPDPRFPAGRVKGALIQKRPMGWYATLIVDGEAKPIPAPPQHTAGVDFGFTALASLSTGEKVSHPHEYRRLERRLGQANRAMNYRLLGRLHQRLANARRVRNHQISRDLVSRFSALYLSRDSYRSMARTRFGKSVHSAGIYQLIAMLHAKSRPGGCQVIEVSSKNSTRTCSACGSLSGPSGRRGLKVRHWACETCGVYHDRDVNAAVNTARAGAVRR